MVVATLINVAEQFSKYPAGRFLSDGPYSGQRFRDEVLVPALEASQTTSVLVVLDGTLGYGSSFLEEAFGGLVRRKGFKAEDLTKRLAIQATDTSLVSEIWSYIRKAKPEKVP